MKINLEEFERLASANFSKVRLYEEVINRLVNVTGANAGVFWGCEKSPFYPIAQHFRESSTPIGISKRDHERMLSQVLTEQRSAVVRPKTIDGSKSTVILVAPVDVREKSLIELVVPDDDRIGDDRDALLQINLICDLLSGSPATNEVPADDPSGEFSLERFSKYVDSLHKSIDRRLTCANIANETRLLLDCDRVSVVLKHRGKYKIFAISGQPKVNRRSSTVHLLEKLSQQVLKSEREFWYPNENELAPQLSKILDQYMALSATRSLVIQPIAEKVEEIVEDPESNERKSNSIIGGIVYEHCNEQWEQATIAPTLQLLTRHGGNALRNSKKHHGLFLYPVWNLLGKSRVLTAPRLLPKTMLVSFAIIALGLFLALWPAKFYVSAQGILVPEHRQLVFPKVAGDVVNVAVEHGQNVVESESLVTLKSESLELRIEEAQGRKETLEQRKRSIERKRFEEAGIPKTESNEDSLNSLQAEIDSLAKQLERLAELRKALTIKSPMNGQVITFDVKQKLTGRSVVPQNVLLEVADPNGNWELVLDVEDRRVGHLLRGISKSESSNLSVEYTLAADPNNSFRGTVSEVANAIQLNGDNEQVIRVKVQLDEDSVALKQAKTGVSAKIYTGETVSIGYLWLHDIPESFKRYIQFYFAN